MRRVICISIVIAVSALLVGCSSVPDHSDAWLSYKYSFDCGSYGACYSVIDNTNLAFSYYLGLGVADPDNYTLEMWLTANGFPGFDAVDAHAIYANLADLQFGRKMNCLQSGQKIACYVINYGPPPVIKNSHGLVPNDLWPDITSALNDAIHDSQSFGTVAMVYDPSISGPNKVAFYAFGTRLGPDFDSTSGALIIHYNALLYDVALDGEGPKSVPRMCMACHGGSYDTGSNTATGAVFLPFDVFSFRYPNQTGYSLDEQQEALRKLNALVAATNPNKPILDLINGLYPNGVTTAGNVAVDGYVPTAWSDNPTLYTSVIRPYCRTCHLAQPEPLNDSGVFAEMAGTVKHMVCDKHDMPHGEVPYGVKDKIGFWNDRVAQQDLGNFFKSASVANSCLPSD